MKRRFSIPAITAAVLPVFIMVTAPANAIPVKQLPQAQTDYRSVDGDLLDIVTTAGRPGTITVCLTSRKQWWKGVEIFGVPQRKAGGVYTQDERRGPECRSVDFGEFAPNHSRLLLMKAKELGVHTGIEYLKFDPVQLNGKTINITWKTDQVVAGVDCGNENQRPCKLWERIPSCNPGMVEDFLKGRCIAGADAPRFQVANEKLGEIAGFILSKVDFARETARNPLLREQLDTENANGAAHAANVSAVGNRQMPDGHLLRTLTVGTHGGVRVGPIGGSWGYGAAIDLTDRLPVHVYLTGDYGHGFGLSATGGVDIGFWVCQANKIGGDVWAVEYGVDDLLNPVGAAKAVADLATSVKAGPSLGVGLWFNYQNEFQGFTITPGAAVGADFGGIVKGTTAIEGDPGVDCTGQPLSGQPVRTGPIMPSPVVPPSASGNVATFFEHCDYQGYSVALPAGQHSLRDLQAFGMRNDDISSIRVSPGVTAVVFEHDGFQGMGHKYDRDIRCLLDDKFNDRLSSAVIVSR